MANVFEKFNDSLSGIKEAEQTERTKEEKLAGLKKRKDEVLQGIEMNGGRTVFDDRELLDRLDRQIKELE
ncbi:MAG: hypothetical protein A3I26_02825 [Candidatus Yanofskybacteria bacterium RIFCSPLOWO2_02_FULL_43_10]|uniref:Uncharacterized protein n=1 Tax=Candidatus Yanofskybacteria bacterium RIFCSPLOWO2_12_FULL_43_11b TaxID=1802710 RepID=A0A1F8HA75_9BACT|nr:MAG: hypothetical protein A2742_01750 [Candidatus Yanofskybacteria bacterium RIFCSPHIGHO2_01_FULL_43_32]OGN11873.1 MAG: hypothetical protein A3C69_01645 [Candidatus Yanofskybacteria bacterium RIFCSPHIGHO2_02_FULL_43_12]OGN18084.1 MAG: hypothetical protein A3E34_02330 [Candidatus Yanofskybacteria bacterium RIFCSPHIGHO2_12_FULL_43_11]OGN25329.1 MAG: hypothetical protein A2923_01540 [Candidatus Yanofskybacteria bacterium RIFCSPLOWO2_01_FULL_43_46]OGN28613.1 MAG: hypothetical protein A3I26_02825